MVNFAQIDKKYKEAVASPSDINRLLPHLFHFAKKCKHITEMGVRRPTSTYAFLAAKPDLLVSYDIDRSTGVDTVEELAPGIFKFILGNTLEVEIDETDFLFIDTYHTATQLEHELALHQNKVRRYLGFHDTLSFWEHGEPPYGGMPKTMACGRGLKHAILPLLKSSQWRIAFMTDKNNGLLILERKEDGNQQQAIDHLKYSLYLNTKKIRRIGIDLRRAYLQVKWRNKQ
ncbi:class I SAM-dependent methyltransferase [Mucilaginibacter myungsuensis]|uniref:Uncharacterized protein n=1 Tax=Mucilaginibacter myungsuensis TaxID=649104 RepID=A0A929PVD5_9SPHI|nr:hypothetical protein [Mucilaginibacter myungsuensis]MBE9660891.1 hypothetical protein [Mucilaginibacter myungsuensis]MDN3600938.1 hypothetical protein [Mucilaginibacter myungsuensis]